MARELKVYGGCYDGRNRVIVAAPTMKAAHEAVNKALGGVSMYSYRTYTDESGNDVELALCLPSPLTVFQVPESADTKPENFKIIG